MLRHGFLGIGLCMVVMGCGGRDPIASFTAAATTNAGRPNSVPPDFVVTPNGYFHPSCIVEIKSDERLRQNRIVEHKDGRVRTIEKCAYSHYDRHGFAIEPEGTTATSPPTINGWVESAYEVTNPIQWLSARWQVPANPPNQTGQTVYYFPGAEDSSNVKSIIQPVLGWNSYLTGWSIASWNCCVSGTTTYSAQIPVNSGDTIDGWMDGTSCSGGVCANWQIVTRDTTTGKQTTLNSGAFGQAFNWVFGGVLEAYLVDNCLQYPANGSVTFTNISAIDTAGSSISHSWTNSVSGGTPSCDYGVRASGNTVEVDSSPLWTSDYSDANGWRAHDYYWQTIQFPDLNGDGKHDVCGRGIGGIYCALSNGSSFGTPTTWAANYSDAAGWNSHDYYWQTIQFPDLNGDGKYDVCGRGINGIYCALSNGSSFGTPGIWASDYSDANGWNSHDYYWQTIQFPDLNGDGKQDVCGRGIGGIYCALSNGSSFGTPSTWAANYSDAAGWNSHDYYWQTIQFPDLNGDGKHDVCGRGIGGIYCALSNGSSFGTPTTWAANYSDAAGWNSHDYYWQTIQFPDLNGDGKYDVCGRGINGIYCALSNGSSFGTPGIWASDYSDANGWNSHDYYWQTIQFPDLNGDGKQDVCGRGIGGIYCALSNGSSYGSPSTLAANYSDAATWNADPAYWKTILYPDLSGNGKQGVCGRGISGIYCVR